MADVVFFVADRLSASSRLRALQYTDFLRQDGVAVRVCSTRPSKYLPYPGHFPKAILCRLLYGVFGVGLIIVQRLFQICVYVLQARTVFLQKDLLFRSRLTFLEGLLFLLARIRRVRVVFDLDDAIYLGTVTRTLPQMRPKIRRLAKAATIVLAGSEPIASELRPNSNNIQLSPTCLALSTRPARSYAGSGDELRLVWTGTASNARYLMLVSAALRRLSETVPVRIELVTRLADLPDDVAVALPGARLTDWSAIVEKDALGRADAALAPLADEPFARAKCGGKVLSYFAAAIPVVASPVGAQASMVRHDITGLVATSDNEWVRCLTILWASQPARRRLGLAGRRFIEDNLAVQRHYPQWREWVLGQNADTLGRGREGHPPVA
jgi:glycosyltransferase involved in cell wall biosynthesis